MVERVFDEDDRHCQRNHACDRRRMNLKGQVYQQVVDNGMQWVMIEVELVD